MNSASAPQARIYFCDSPGDILLLTRTDIAREKRDTIRALHRLEYRYNLKILFYFVLWIGAGALYLRTSSLLWHVPAYFLMACAITGLPILMHEANHNLLFRNRRLNHWIGFLCGLPALVSITAYRTIHLPHHASTGTAHDPDAIEHSTPKALPLVLFYYLFLIVGAYLYLGHLAVTSLRRADARHRRRIVAEYALIVLAFGVAFANIPSPVVLHVWLIPLMIGAQLTNVRGLAEHGLTSSGNPFTDTRCVISNRFVSYMMSNLNYHLDHHLFPGVPWYNLRQLHGLLADEYRSAGASVYRSYTAFLVDFLRVTWTGIIPNVRLIPEHLREDVCG